MDQLINVQVFKGKTLKLEFYTYQRDRSFKDTDAVKILSGKLSVSGTDSDLFYKRLWRKGQKSKPSLREAARDAKVAGDQITTRVLWGGVCRYRLHVCMVSTDQR